MGGLPARGAHVKTTSLPVGLGKHLPPAVGTDGDVGGGVVGGERVVGCDWVVGGVSVVEGV